MLTKESDYAIRMVEYLKRKKGNNGIAPVSEIAEATLVPYRFARKIARQLCTDGLLISTRGKTGGIRINPEMANANVYDVVSIVDPKGLIMNRCLIDPDCCQRSGYCTMHQKFIVAQQKYEKLLKSVKI